jgi:hypothetical protein
VGLKSEVVRQRLETGLFVFDEAQTERLELLRRCELLDERQKSTARPTRSFTFPRDVVDLQCRRESADGVSRRCVIPDLVGEPYELTGGEEVSFRSEDGSNGEVKRPRSAREGKIRVLAEAEVIVLSEVDDAREELGGDEGDGRGFEGNRREGEQGKGVGKGFEGGGAGGVWEDGGGSAESLDDRLEKLADLLREAKEGRSASKRVFETREANAPLVDLLQPLPAPS